jgi:hypothetical protein
VDSWTLELFEGEQMFIYAIAPPPANIMLSVLKDGQTIINRQNTALAGAPEFLNAPPLVSAPSIYEIRVETEGAIATEYAIVAYFDAQSPITFNGMIQSGAPRNSVQLPIDAVHYWFFTANAGDDLTIRIDPAEEVDPSLDLYEPGGEKLMNIDNNFDGQEELQEVTLGTTGMYAIRVTEVFSQQMTYDLSITLQ